MNISMQILEAWLQPYQPVSILADSDRSIERIQVLPAEKVDTEKTLYIGRMKDFFSFSLAEDIFFMHKNNIIYVKSISLYEAVNIANEVWTFYNNWEKRFKEAICMEQPEQQLVDVCCELLGPAFLLDMRMETIAISKAPEKESINEIFDELRAHGHTSIDWIKEIRDGLFSRKFNRHFKADVDHDERVIRYTYSIISSYVTDENELLGHLLILFDEEPKVFQIQLASVVSDILNEIRHKKSVSYEDSYIENCLKQILESDAVDARMIQLFAEMNGWEYRGKYCIVVFSGIEKYIKNNTVLSIQRLRSLLHGCTIVQCGINFYACVNLEIASQYQYEIERICEGFEGIAGVSMEFTDLEKICIFKKQAEFALENKMQGRKQMLFYEVALKALLIHENQELKTVSLHPAIGILSDFDERNKGDLLGTLTEFLKNERSLKLTAECLMVHRNTIIKRLEKIAELLPTNFDSYYERAYFLASIQLLIYKKE